MSIEEIIERLDVIASNEKSIRKMCDDRWRRARAKKNVSTIRAAIALLKTHPEAQPNEPLTLEELRKMEGWPVWTVTKGISDPGRWELVIDAECEDRLEMAERADGFYEIDTDSYGKTWLAYRRPSKEDAELMAWLYGDLDETIDAAELPKEETT